MDDNNSESFKTNIPLNNQSNISNFLLRLCNLEGVQVLKNKAKGNKQLLSFKNINQFSSISEERIITKSSPFYFTQNNTNHVLEQSIVSLILEGMDFSKVESIEDPQKKALKISGQLEFIDRQIINYTDKIQKQELLVLAGDNNRANLKQILSKELENKMELAKSLETRILKICSQTNILSERNIYYSEIVKRFEILRRQYTSDLERLEFIKEADALTSQLPGKICPVCSQPFSNGNNGHMHEIQNFREGVLAEFARTDLKLTDLNHSIEVHNKELSEVSVLIERNRAELVNLELELEGLKPQIEKIEISLQEIFELEKASNQLAFLNEEVEHLYGERARLEGLKQVKETTDIQSICDYDILKQLASYIEKRLVNWKYNDFPRVIFNSEFKIFDIVISNKSRGSYGKGRRALSYTASLMGFLDYCIFENRNFSNLLIFDSPLTTFKDSKDKYNDESDDELLSIDEYFFEDISKTTSNAQIIIFENKVPKVQEGLNIIEFSRMPNEGRYGFYPIN